MVAPHCPPAPENPEVPGTRAVLLDAGLTLLRARPSLGGVYTNITRTHGLEVEPADFDRAAEAAFHAQAAEHRDAGEAGMRTSEDLERASWHRHARRVMDGVPAMAGIDFEAWFEDLYRDFGSASVWAPFEDVLPALDLLAERGVRLAVVSNWDRRLHRILEDNGLHSRFEAVIVSSEIGWRKPHPEIFRRALAALDIRPEAALHVGDSVGDDVAGARAAGIRAALLDRRGEKAADGVPVIRDLHGVVSLL
jgi:putative hydrolase of the HAD superfamily